MRKNLSKVVSMVLTVFFLFSIIPMTPVFAAPGGSSNPNLTEKFENWTNNGPFNPTSTGALYDGSNWVANTTSKTVDNNYVSVEEDSAGNKLLKLKQAATANTQTANEFFLQNTGVTQFDSATDLATISFKAKRTNNNTKTFVFLFDTTNYFTVDYDRGMIYKRYTRTNAGYANTNNAIVADDWNYFKITLDYTADKMIVNVNGTDMTPQNASTDSEGNAYVSISDAMSTEGSIVTAADFSGFGFGFRGAQTDLAVDAGVEIDDLSICTYTYAQLEEESSAALAITVEEHFESLDGASVVADVDLSDDTIQALVDAAGATLEWKSGNTDYISDTGVVTQPAEDAAPVDVELSYAIKKDGETVAENSYTVTVLPANIKRNMDFNIVGSGNLWSEWIPSATVNTVSVIDEPGNTTNKVANVQSVAGTAASYDIFSTGLVWTYGSGVGGSTSYNRISFRLARANEATEKVTFFIRTTSNSRRMALSFNLQTGEVSSLVVGSDTAAAFPATPAGSRLYIEKLIDNPLDVGEWIDIDVYLHSNNGRKLMIYADGMPCVYGADVFDEENVKLVSARQPMLPQVPATDILGSQNMRIIGFSANPADVSGAATASFYVDDVEVEVMSEDKENSYVVAVNVLAPTIDLYSVEPVNKNKSLETLNNGANISWTSSVEGILNADNNRIMLTDANAITNTLLTATVTTGSAKFTRSWNVKVAPKIMASVTSVGIADNKLNSVTISKLCTLPGTPKVVLGVYDDTTKLYKSFKLLTPAADSDTITLETPIELGTNDVVKAYIWNMDSLTPLAVEFSN